MMGAPDERAVEAVARALYAEAHDEHFNEYERSSDRDLYVKEARAAIAAYEQVRPDPQDERARVVEEIAKPTADEWAMYADSLLAAGDRLAEKLDDIDVSPWTEQVLAEWVEAKRDIPGVDA